MPEKKRDRTHDPKPTSGWWGESDRHYVAALKNNSNGGLGAGKRVKRAVKATVHAPSKRGHRVPKEDRYSGRRAPETLIGFCPCPAADGNAHRRNSEILADPVGVAQWQSSGLQNREPEFDSPHPCWGGRP